MAPTTARSEYEYYGNGTVDVRETITSIYDRHGDLLKAVSSETVPGVTTIRTTMNTYDRRGNLITSFFEVDLQGDGNVNSVATTTYIYDVGGGTRQ